MAVAESETRALPQVQLEGKTCIVTGGAGFIGSHLCERLARSGAGKIVVLDSLRYADPSRLRAMGERWPIELRVGDLGHDAPRALLAGVEGADLLFHLAAEKHNQSMDAPQRVLQANVLGTERLFDWAAHAGVKKVVFASSLYAHGRMQLPPMRESDVPEPTTVYGLSKLAGEHLLRHFALERGLRGAILRLFFVYGPYQHAGAGYKSVIVRNFQQMLRNEPPTIVGDGQQALDYVYVDDAVDALLLASTDAADGGLFHIGSGNAPTIEELTRVMQRVAGSTLSPRRLPPDRTHGTVRVADPRHALENLGWRTRVSLNDGLRRVFEWMKSVAPET